MGPEHMMQLIERLGSMGILALVLWVIFMRWLPRRDQDFTEALRFQRENFERWILSVTDKMERLHEALTRHIEWEESQFQETRQEIEEIKRKVG